ncbi:condensation domain-containing protein [Amycolatopsis sp. CA-230715]|uniref:condensation domain-containing protein n=1 Tax=Amycolatopsis sp. CA-230715 TaxID=2745196 RepID=UPI001C020AC9|nr:condensation domain-containing protein [Amycolatopsis sp. CA-230715]
MTPRREPASIAQRLLWLIKHYRPDFGALNCPLLCRLRGPLDEQALRSAVHELTVRHESLRTTFAGRAAKLEQLVHPPRALPWTVVEVPRGTDPGELVAAEVRNPLDPVEWPMRVTLWRVGEDEHVLCVNLHHLVTDAWSTGVLLGELCALYGGAALPEVGWQYADFASWQHEQLSGDALSRHREYWRRQLTGAQLPRFPATRARPGDGRTGSVLAEVDPAVVPALWELARAHHTTLFTVLLTTFHLHLRGRTGQDDLAVASMFANRSRAAVRDTVGLLANMVLLRVRAREGATFAELLRQAHAAVIGAFAFQDLPTQMLPAGVLDTGGRRVDDVVFNVMAEVDHARRAGGLDVELLVPDELGSRFGLELALVPIGGTELRAVLFFNDAQLTEDEATAFLHEYTYLVSLVAKEPETVVSDILA